MNEPATRLPRWSPREGIDRLREHLAGGGLLAIPTESSYGLAADPRNQEGVEAIYRVKERERGKALLVVGADLGQLAALGVDPEASGAAEMAACWPAPLTVILPLEPGAALPAAAGGSTLAFRIPAHDELRKMLSRLGFALTATSANRAGAEPIVDPADLDALLAGHDAIVWDEGELPGGPPSTLVEKTASGRWQVLRQGAYRGKALPPQ